jgi:hypothetical protein
LHDVRVSAQQQTAVSTVQTASPSGRAARFAGLLEENGTLVMILAAFAAVLITHLPSSLAPDGWMALLSGREIAQHGLPSHDTLTVWAHGHRWVDQQWLAQLVLYELHRLGGLKLVMLVHAALVTCGLVGAALLARRLGGTARSATWVCLPVVVAVWPGAAVMRPQSFAYVLFVAVLWLLLDELRSPSRRVYLVLPLLALWANLHGSVIVGSALVSGFALVELFVSLRATPRTVRRRSPLLLVAPWLCVFVSPYATSLPGYYRDVLFSGGFGHYVTEWAPTTLTLQNAPVFLLAAGGLWLLGRTAGTASAFETLAFLGLTILALDAVRNAVWLGLLALVVLPRLVDSLRSSVVEPARLNRLLATAMLVGVLVAIAGVATEPASWFTPAFPSAASDAAATAAGRNGKVFANEQYADWLMWSHPELAGRVAYDSRFELLTRRQLQTVVDFRNRVGAWTSAVNGYSVLVLDRTQDGDAAQALLARHAFHRIKRADDALVLGR